MLFSIHWVEAVVCIDNIKEASRVLSVFNAIYEAEGHYCIFELSRKCNHFSTAPFSFPIIRKAIVYQLN